MDAREITVLKNIVNVMKKTCVVHLIVGVKTVGISHKMNKNNKLVNF